MSRSLSNCLILMAMLALPACRRAPVLNQGVGTYGPATYMYSRGGPGERPLPGVDRGSFGMGICYQGKTALPAFAVWVGEDGGGQFSGSTEVLDLKPSQRGCRFHGSLVGVPFECQTADAKTGPVTIGGETFQLENGGLFLV